MKTLTTLLICLLLIGCKSAASKHHATIVEIVDAETGLFRKSKNPAYTVVELEDNSRHRLAGSWGEVGDTITVWVGGGRVETKPFEYQGR